jgi:hypothetical protein
MRDENPKVSRRFAIATISAVSGALALPVAEEVAHATTPAPSPGTLVAPLTAGSRFGRWQLEEVGVLDQGALVVTVSGATGKFHLELLARDPSSWMPRAPGETAHFAVHVVNEGDGTSRTDEDHGLCAMTLATFIAKNETAEAAKGFSTLAHRLDLESRGLLRRP